MSSSSIPIPIPIPTVKLISECFIKPKQIVEEAKHPIYLSPWDLSLISVHYNQKGLLFAKPRSDDLTCFLQNLKDSLSITLTHFYPLASRLVTKTEPPCCFIFVEPCNSNSLGAKFIHATVDLTLSDLLNPSANIPHSFFAYNKEINYDGHVSPLLIVQVTELVDDGIFIGFTINHVLADGTSLWHFINSWSEIFFQLAKIRDASNQALNEISSGTEDCYFNNHSISRPPIHRCQNWLPLDYPHQYNPTINLPFTHPDQFISQIPENPLLREKVFHFSSKSLSKLKAKANANCERNIISTFQALAALVWRCVTRCRHLPCHQPTSCRIVVNNRARLDPPLSENYFGNPIQSVNATATAGDLLDKGLGWAAWLLHEAVANHTNKRVHEWVKSWMKSPVVVHNVLDPSIVHFGSSPRFDVKVDGFGLGKPLAIRSGKGNKFDGKMNTYPGLGVAAGEGIVLEVCLSPDSMGALESDQEFMDALFG